MQAMTRDSMYPPSAVSAHDTVDELVGVVRAATPLRIDFLQVRVGELKIPGPAHIFVNNGDRRGLLLYLLMMARASRREPWNVSLPAAVWARALGLDDPQSGSATSAVSKAWRRLEDRHLIERSRKGRVVDVTALREDGTGSRYTHPASEGGYLQLPNAFWLQGPDGTDERWYEVLGLPSLAMLLISSSLRAGFRLPLERVPEWYGFSSDTALRGFRSLAEKGLVMVNHTYQPAPLSATGYTYQNSYTLTSPFKNRVANARLRKVAV